MITTSLAIISMLIPVFGVGAVFPGRYPTVFPWYPYRPSAQAQNIDSWSQQHSNEDMMMLRPHSAVKQTHYISHATPSSGNMQNYKPYPIRYYRPNENYENYLYTEHYRHPQNSYRKPTNMYDNEFNDPTYQYNRGIVESVAGALGIKIPVEINIRDLIDQILKFGQRGTMNGWLQQNSNLYHDPGNMNTNLIPNKYPVEFIQKPLNEATSPSNLVQFNVFNFIAGRTPESMPEYGPAPSTEFISNDVGYRPDNTHPNCAPNSNPEVLL